jgi:hypothetical protein
MKEHEDHMARLERDAAPIVLKLMGRGKGLEDPETCEVIDEIPIHTSRSLTNEVVSALSNPKVRHLELELGSSLLGKRAADILLEEGLDHQMSELSRLLDKQANMHKSMAAEAQSTHMNISKLIAEQKLEMEKLNPPSEDKARLIHLEERVETIKETYEAQIESLQAREESLTKESDILRAAIMLMKGEKGLNGHAEDMLEEAATSKALALALVRLLKSRKEECMMDDPARIIYHTLRNEVLSMFNITSEEQCDMPSSALIELKEMLSKGVRP